MYIFLFIHKEFDDNDMMQRLYLSLIFTTIEESDVMFIMYN